MIDMALVGRWTNGGAGIWEILRNGDFYRLGSATPYVLQAGGDRLVISPPSGPETFVRGGGRPGGLSGLWVQTHAEPDGTWIEEWVLRGDGSYTIHWTHDGSFDSEHFGWFTDTGSEITQDERRGVMASGPGAQLIQSHFWGALNVGSYSIAPDGSSWTFHLPGGDITYQRA